MEVANEKILQFLNEKQKEVCVSDKNYVLIACPGSGKTRTIVHRLAYLSEKNSTSRKINLAITYTNRAADEMESRLYDMGIDSDTIWTGTIHKFCMQFIIRPYAMYSSRLKNGFHIIDEYKKNEYGKIIAENLGITIQRQKYFDNDNIRKEYQKKKLLYKEIDFDDILQESYNLLNNYPFIAENIALTIRSIHVDEYQDTNELQYCILAMLVLKNKEINILFIGDVNQAIYNNLGGVAKTYDEICQLFGVPFVEDYLVGCYRSTQRLIDYYDEYAVQKVCIKSLSVYADEKGRIVYNSSTNNEHLALAIAGIITQTLHNGIKEEDICVSAPQWNQLYSLSNRLQELLPNVEFNAPEITPFKYDPLNPFYILTRLAFTKPGKHVRIRKKLGKEFLDIMSSEYCVSFRDRFDVLTLLKTVNNIIISRKFTDALDCLSLVFKNVMSYCSGDISQNDLVISAYKDYVQKAKTRIEKYHLLSDYDSIAKCFEEKSGVVITTFHGTKGEEYDTVIAFGLLNGLLPHWDYIYKDHLKPERLSCTKRLLYVLCSRAKKNLYLFSERGRLTQSGSSYTPTDELISYRFPYDHI